MKLLDLYSGTQSVSKIFKEKGWDVYTVDNDPYFKDITHFTEDAMTLTSDKIRSELGQPDVIWASPPCNAFSVASISTHWTGGNQAYIPQTELARLSIDLIKHTLVLIDELKPTYWFIENPRGVLRKLPFMQDLPRYTVWYCQYQDERAKPTDIWTNHPNPQFKPVCHNGNKNCHHQPAPRGSKTGTQGRANARERSKIPEELVEHIYSLVAKKE